MLKEKTSLTKFTGRTKTYASATRCDAMRMREVEGGNRDMQRVNQASLMDVEDKMRSVQKWSDANPRKEGKSFDAHYDPCELSRCDRFSPCPPCLLSGAADHGKELCKIP